MQSFHRIPVSAAARTEIIHTERVLAIARAMLAVVALLALQFVAEASARSSAVAIRLLLVFTPIALTLVVVAWSIPMTLHRWAAPLHTHDLLWAVAITTFTEGPGSIFFALFLYVLVSAAYRWGFSSTLDTAILANVLLIGQAWLLASGAIPLPARVDWTGLVVRGPLLIGLAVFVGYLADEQRRLRDEAALISGLVGSARVEAGLRNSLAAGASELLKAFRSNRLWAVLTDQANASIVLCDVQRRPDGVELTLLPLSATEAAAWEFVPPQPCEAFVVRRRPRGFARALTWTLWPGERRLAGGTAASILTDAPWEAVVGANVAHGEWAARLVLLDPPREERRIARGAFLHSALSQAAPAFHSVSLMLRLRSRIGAVERARVARELHDGVIQSLSGLDMQIEAARRQLDSTPGAVPEALERVQTVLREEVLNVRDLMHQLRHTEVDPRRVVDHLAETVERFRRDTGIAAAFVSDLPDPELPREVARELVRMLQELLVNIRKHSGARNVVARFGVSDDAWRLVVDDDGRGFDFDGRYTLAELDTARRGPVVLKERVRGVGGQLWLTSEPGHGTRVEIHVPRGAHAG